MRAAGKAGRHLWMSPGAKVSVVVLVMLTLAMAGIAVLFASNEVRSNNRQWCDTLTLLTSTPVPKPADPAANPSRAQAYTLYSDFLELRRHFGC